MPVSTVIILSIKDNSVPVVGCVVFSKAEINREVSKNHF
jgi:hypothetical protein